MHIAQVAFRAFLDDTRLLVSDGICCDMAQHILKARSPASKILEITCAEAREKHLKQWLTMDIPLSCGQHGVGTFQTLLQAVISAEKDIIGGLSNWKENATVYGLRSGSLHIFVVNETFPRLFL